MIRKTMRIGEVRTSIKLEQDFWGYLREVADDRGIRLSALVNEVAHGTRESSNLASSLRTFSLTHARMRAQQLEKELERLALAGSTNDLIRVLEACPLPCVILDQDRAIRHLNRAFALWLNLDPRATVAQRLENIMILRGPGLREMWPSLSEGRMGRAGFNATYVSPGKVRTAQALAVPLGASEEARRRGFVVLFETLSGRG